MNPSSIIVALVATLGTTVLAGIVLTRIWRKRKDRFEIRQRLEAALRLAVARDGDSDEQSISLSAKMLSSADSWLVKRLHSVGLGIEPQSFVLASALFAATFAVLAFLINDTIWIAPVIGAAVFVTPYVVLHVWSARIRAKFVRQLPDALDLLISVLRSGLSLPLAIKSVAEEFPAPAGTQFAQILNRLNLGQPLPDAMAVVAERFELFELDLVRRAAAIQIEVGGSLAELLDKTNATLKERLRLKTKVDVLTAPGKLSAWIIAALPFGMAAAFQLINPLYLRPLYMTEIGKALVLVAIICQIVGIVIIRRMATIRI